MMDRRTWLAGTLGLLAGPLGAEAQEAGKVPRIGYLTQRSGPGTREEAFRQGLRDLGYVRESDIVIEYRYAAGLDRLSEQAADLVRIKVNVIVTGGPTATRRAMEATRTIPIVMAQDNDPVGNGFVASLARPGGNVTGLSNLTAETSGKRLELLKEIVPRLSRVAVIETSRDKGNARELRATELAAASLGLRLQYLDVLDPRDMETALRAARQGQADAVLTQSSPVVLRHPAQYASLAAKSRLPVMLPSRELVEAGGLMSYGASVPDLFRRAAAYVDKLLKGAKPADLPIEQPTKFEFIINLKAAKQIGLTIPSAVLARADEVIQ